jgi:hypothetical protein
MTIKSRSNEERSGNTRAQMKRLAAIYITSKTTRRTPRTPKTTRTMKTRGQPSGGSCP